MREARFEALVHSTVTRTSDILHAEIIAVNSRSSMRQRIALPPTGLRLSRRQHLSRRDVVGNDIHGEGMSATCGQQLRRQLQLHLVLIHLDIDEQPQRNSCVAKSGRDLWRPPIKETPS